MKVALQERKERLSRQASQRERAEGLRRFLEEELWPQVPPEVLGRPLTRDEREAILGYGEKGV